MAWRELQLIGLPRGLIDATSAALFRLGTAGVQEDALPGQAPAPRQPWDTGPSAPLPKRVLLRAWFEDADEPSITTAMATCGAELQWADVEEIDWEEAFRARFPPLRITESLTIAPPWNAPEGALVIEPGQGFGTGQHPTTRQALQLFEDSATDSTSVLDIGCGSGILALAAARHGLRAHGVDVEPEAVRDAIRNAERNGLDCTFATTPVEELREPADLVFGNLHAELLVALSTHLIRLGTREWIFAGILADREQKVLDAFAGLRLVERRVDGEWVALRYGPVA